MTTPSTTLTCNMLRQAYIFLMSFTMDMVAFLLYTNCGYRV